MKFVHFGCWNQGRCNIDINDTSNGMSLVFNRLHTTSIQPDFYVVAGDNYYAIKDNDGKKNYFSQTDFRSGMDCLQNLATVKNKNVYVLMGNHDIQQTNLYQDTNRQDKIDKCYITQEQLKRMIPKKKRIIYDKDTIIIFINSSLYTKDLLAKDEKTEEIECLKMYRKTNKTSLTEIMTMEEEEINSQLRLVPHTQIKNLVIIGHHPIYGYKYKTEKDSQITKIKAQQLNKNGKDYLTTLFQKFPNARYYYLCADIHQYQQTEFTMNGLAIHQYIVGTGGTGLDTEPEPDTALSVPKPIDITNFKLLDKDIRHGFLYVQTQTDGELKLTFHPVRNITIQAKTTARKKSQAKSFTTNRRNSKARASTTKKHQSQTVRSSATKRKGQLYLV